MSNYIKLKSHLCSDSCRGRSTNSLKCFICDKEFYSKCFAIEKPLYSKFNNGNSFIRFICGICQSNKQKRRSISSSISAVSTPAPKTPETNGSSDDSHQLNSNLKLIIDKLPLLSQMETPSPTIDSANNNNTTNNTEDLNITTMLNNIYSLIIKSSDKIQKLHTADHEKDSIRILTSLIEKGMENNTSKNIINKKADNINASKLNDWSMHFDSNSSMSFSDARPSLVVQQSVDNDILAIIKNSESRTWDALDLILKRMNEQSGKLDSLLHLANAEFDSNSRQQSAAVFDMCRNTQIASPLVNSIELNQSNMGDTSSVSIQVSNETTRNDSVLFAPPNTNRNQDLSSSTLEREAMAAMVTLDDHEDQSSDIQGLDLTSGSQSNNAGVSLAAHSDNAGVNSSAHSDNAGVHSSSLSLQSLPHDPANNLSKNSQTATSDINESTKNQNNSKMQFCEIHVSKFQPDTTSDQLFQYIATKCGIGNDKLRVFKLVKRGQDTSLLKFVNFKIEIVKDYADAIGSISFWPNKYIKVKPFTRNPFIRNVCSLNLSSSANASLANESTTNGVNSPNSDPATHNFLASNQITEIQT